MKIDLKHSAIQKCSQECIDDVIGKSRTIAAFCGKINKVADEIALIDEQTLNPFYTPVYSDKEVTIIQSKNKIPPLSGPNVANKFKGDIFELFTEFFIKMSPIDDRVDVYDYQLVTKEDTGVDGWGYNRKGEVVTVQVKYRMWDWQLTSIKEHLDNFRWTSYKKYDIKPEDVGRMLIVTTGQEIHWRTLERYFSGKVRCISNNASYGCLKGANNKTIDDIFSLQSVANYSNVFWKSFRENIERKK
jgi:hypothetical protein